MHALQLACASAACSGLQRALPAAPWRPAAVARSGAARHATLRVAASVFSLKPLENYPYKTVRRAKPPRQWKRHRPRPPQLPDAPPEPQPTREEAAAAAATTPNGAAGLLQRARDSISKGEHAHAYRAALLAAASAAEGSDVAAAALEAQRDAQVGLLVDAWASALARAATLDAARDARAAARLAATPPRKREGSAPKPRQGYTKPVMRLLHVRLCCSCRALAPRELMWRVMQLRPQAPPGEVKPLKRRRKIRRRWVVLRRKPAAPAAHSSQPSPQPDEDAPAAVEDAQQQPQEAPAPKREEGSSRAAPGDVDAADRPRAPRKGRIVLQRVPGSASEALQADEAVWSPPRRCVRSAYICRRLVCVQAAVKRKAITRALGSQPSPPICEALLAATKAEEAALAAAAPGAPPPGVSAARAKELAALIPNRTPLPATELRGPHDRWESPPQGPR